MLARIFQGCRRRSSGMERSLRSSWWPVCDQCTLRVGAAHTFLIELAPRTRKPCVARACSDGTWLAFLCEPRGRKIQMRLESFCRAGLYSSYLHLFPCAAAKSPASSLQRSTVDPTTNRPLGGFVKFWAAHASLIELVPNMRKPRAARASSDAARLAFLVELRGRTHVDAPRFALPCWLLGGGGETRRACLHLGMP